MVVCIMSIIAVSASLNAQTVKGTFWNALNDRAVHQGELSLYQNTTEKANRFDGYLYNIGDK